MLRLIIYSFSILCFVESVQAQHMSLSRLFYPNITLRAEYLPDASVGANRSFGYSRTSFLALIPLRSEVQAGIGIRKKFDVQIKHTILTGNFSQINPAIDGNIQPANGFKTASLGAILLRASLRDKIWVYGGGIGLTESNETFFTPQPFLYGGAARLRVFGLQTQILYGTAVVYNQKFRVIPIFGINKRINKDWRISALLPFNIDVNYRTTKWLNFDFIGTVGGYSGGFQSISQTEKLLRRSNYQHIKFSLAANAHLLTVLNLSLEAGVASFRQVRIFNSARENLESYQPNLTPFVGASVRYITSKSKGSSKLLKKVGIGGDGMNW